MNAREFFLMIMFGHFVSYLNRLGNRNKYICFCFTRLLSHPMLGLRLHRSPTCSCSVIKICKHIFATLAIACSRETIANRGSGRKLVYQHFRGAASRLRRSKHNPNKNKATLTLTSFGHSPKLTPQL